MSKKAVRPSEALLRGWGAREGGSCSEVRPGLRCHLPKTLVCAEPGWAPEWQLMFCYCLPLGTCCSCWKGNLRWGRVEASCWTFRAGEKVAVFAATDRIYAC